MSQKSATRKFFYYYGVELSFAGSQLLGDCFLCGKEQHFYVDPESGKWNCKSCGAGGNQFTFLTQLANTSHDDDESLGELAENRGIKISTLRDSGVKKSVVSGCYLLPVRNSKNNVINLYKSEPQTNGNGTAKFPVLSGPSPCNQQLYLGDDLRKNQTVYICEGHWDALAWKETLLHLQRRGERLVKKGRPDTKKSLYASYEVTGAPGATTFSEEWLRSLKNRDLVLLYDNDEAGKKGVQRVLKLIRESPININSIKMLVWRDNDPNDIRDLVTRDGYLKAYEYVLDRLIDVNVEQSEEADDDIEPETCDTLEELFEHFEGELLMTDSIRDTMTTMAAVTVSVAPQGSQLGLRVIGPPGSAKSTLAEAVSGCKALTYPTSKFTGLISGFPTIKKAQQIANQMNNCNVIVKDADVMMQLPNRKQIESEIRDALGDGVIRANYRTGKTEVLYTNFAMTQCGTFALKELDDSNLGSRFVDIFIADRETDTDEIALAAIKSEISKSYKSLPGEEGKSGNKILAPPTAGFLLAKRQWVEDGLDEEIDVPDLRLRQILAMGKLIVWSRAKVNRQGKDDLKSRPEPEHPTRVSAQLTKLAKMIALVQSNDPKKIGVNRKTMSVLQRICRDTCYGFHFEVMQTLYHIGDDGMTAEQLGWKLGLQKTQARQHCIDMLEIGILKRKKTKDSYGQGRKAHYYILNNDKQCNPKKDVRDSFKLAFSKR